MADGVKTAKRAYHSPLRADQAQQTRRRVLESARRLFVDHGYAGTTVATVADDAGVSPETIYLYLGGKRGLLEGVMDITGPHDTTADDDAWWQMVAGLATSSERLTKMIEYSCRILARTRPIHAIIRGAADKEAFAAALGQQLLQERLTNQTERIRRYLADDLTPGLSVAEAGERYCALASPDLYHVLTVQLHWTAKHHQHWLTTVLHTELLGSNHHLPSDQPQ
jgi:AcrR family transcriptional regulator